MNTDKWTTILGQINAGVGIATTVSIAAAQSGVAPGVSGKAAFAGGLLLSVLQGAMGYLSNKPSIK